MARKGGKLMMRAGENRLGHTARQETSHAGAVRARQSGRGGVRSAARGGPGTGRSPGPGRAATAVLYACMQAVMMLAAAVYFRRVRIVGRQGFPARGPAVLVANHPAAWTDVVVLDVAFGRKLHFLAHEPLFHPWPRGGLLRLFGSLPVFFRRETPDGMERNLETFARCHALLDRGEVIAVFPEGTSEDDRVLQPLKTGAARMLLEGSSDVWCAIPVAIRYEDRLAFRADVTIAVGEALATEPFRRRWSADPNGAAHAFTDVMTHGLEDALATAAAHARAAREEGPARGRRTAWEAPVALLGGAGWLLHVPALIAIEAAARHWMGRPQQLALGRIVSGLLIIPAWYALLAGALVLAQAGPWAFGIAAIPALGWIACLDLDRRRARLGPGREAS